MEHDEQACSCGHHHGHHDHSEHEKHDGYHNLLKHQDHHEHDANCGCATEADHSEITVTRHEGAIICSVERVIAKEYAVVRDALEKEMKILAEWVEDQGGIVGHIKAFLTENAWSSMLSTTGGDVQIKENRTPKVTVNMAVIVFVKDESLLRAKLVAALKMLE